jgi:predicted Zn-dependent peptidase
MQKVVLSELASGERVISERMASVRSVALGFWIGVGSRDETPSRAGITHFIEHLLFKGTRSYEARQIAEIFDELGGELNAATSREHTVVYGRVPYDQLERAVDVMSDMVFVPTFSEVDSEREVVLEEIAMLEDAPQDQVHDLVSMAVFGGHPLGRPVLGRSEVISSVSRRTLSSFHDSMYHPGNVVVAAAGNLAHDRLASLVAKAAAAREHEPGRPYVRKPLASIPTPSIRFQRKDTEQYHVCLAAPGIARSDRRRFAATLLDSILAGSASSRLFQEIREKRGMAYSVYSFVAQYSDTGLIGISLSTREDNVGPCLEIVTEQVAEIAEGRFHEGELERAKEHARGRIMLSMESTSTRMTRLGRALVSDTELLSPERIIAELEAVRPDAVSELARMFLAPERISVAGIGPDEDLFYAAAGAINPELARRSAA